MAAMITAEQISKRYGEVQALAAVSIEVHEGELYGLIGPDGAGKTTLFRILTTLLPPDEGRATVAGMDIAADYRAIRAAVGYMPGRFSLYQDLTVEENLRFFATLFGTRLEDNYDLVRDIYVQIEPFRRRRAGRLSGGMKQKLALCCALIHRPRVLFLDEPTTGVDVVSRHEFWDMLAGLRRQGITLLVSTPYMDEAVRCDRIALIQTGRILSVDTPAGIVRRYPDALFALRAVDMRRLTEAVRRLPEVKSSFAFGRVLHVSFNKDDAEAPRRTLAALAEADCQGVEMTPIEPGIEDCFIRYMM
ncbi:ATPase [Tannerella sp. oral taxon 808]|nr:ATPase [Tannerella sp. oral taxon 808]